jgi:S-adenosylmethionine hydrolase
MAEAPIITLTTDFGLADGYVGTMKGVILDVEPGARIVDLSHDIAPQDIAGGAFVLYRAAPYFPPDTIHVAVVDPGVGSARRAMLLVTDHGWFVGPDNGLFTYVLREAGARAAGWAEAAGLPAVWDPRFDLADALRAADPARLPTAYALTNPAYWRPTRSATFHGRDVFAPVAAHLATGVPPDAVGPPLPLDRLTLLPQVTPTVTAAGIAGRVIACDHFGNLITNVAAGLLAPLGPLPTVRVTLAGRSLPGVQPTYAVVAPGTPLALINSAGLLEIAVREGHAGRQLGLGVGAAVVCAGADSPPAGA